jgi:GntR family transcriptional regulator/MocR family aminotransferase
MLWLSIDRTSDIPLVRQIYLDLRQRVLQGELSAGTRLPSSRELAVHLGVSRNSVLDAYDQLSAEGYLESKAGSGTYVASGAYWELAVAQPAIDQALVPSSMPIAPGWIDFRSGVPALDHLPRKLWGQLAKQVSVEAPATLFGYGAPEGCTELRTVLSNYLLRTRGVRSQAEQLVITSGAAQAFSLVGKLLLNPGDTLVLEDPTAPEMRQIFAGLGGVVQSVPVDDRGIQTHRLPSRSPRFVLVTPSHQFPLGSVLTIQRRIELLHYARASDSYVIEDDYDNEFRHDGTPVRSLQELDPERVIYVGTFSKILAPGIRLGYVVLPLHLVERCRYLKRLMDLHSSSFEQLILAQFIATGHLERHIARMKKLYRRRRNALRRSLMQHLSDQVAIAGDSTGLHLVADLANIQ